MFWQPTGFDLPHYVQFDFTEPCPSRRITTSFSTGNISRANIDGRPGK
jgi:hypothetical protein